MAETSNPLSQPGSYVNRFGSVVTSGTSTFESTFGRGGSHPGALPARETTQTTTARLVPTAEGSTQIAGAPPGTTRQVMPETRTPILSASPNTITESLTSGKSTTKILEGPQQGTITAINPSPFTVSNQLAQKAELQSSAFPRMGYNILSSIARTGENIGEVGKNPLILPLGVASFIYGAAKTASYGLTGQSEKFMAVGTDVGKYLATPSRVIGDVASSSLLLPPMFKVWKNFGGPTIEIVKYEAPTKLSPELPKTEAELLVPTTETYTGIGVSSSGKFLGKNVQIGSRAVTGEGWPLAGVQNGKVVFGIPKFDFNKLTLGTQTLQPPETFAQTKIFDTNLKNVKPGTVTTETQYSEGKPFEGLPVGGKYTEPRTIQKEITQLLADRSSAFQSEQIDTSINALKPSQVNLVLGETNKPMGLKDIKSAGDVWNFLTGQKKNQALYGGSFSAAQQMPAQFKTLRGQPSDIDLYYKGSLDATEKFTAQLADKLNAQGRGYPVRVSSTSPTLIESEIAPGQFKNAIDIHSAEEIAPASSDVSGTGIYGVPFGKKPVVIENQPFVPLEELQARKIASITRIRPTDEGLFMSPESHRSKDIPDAFFLQRTGIQSGNPARANLAQKLDFVSGYYSDKALGGYSMIGALKLSNIDKAFASQFFAQKPSGDIFKYSPLVTGSPLIGRYRDMPSISPSIPPINVPSLPSIGGSISTSPPSLSSLDLSSLGGSGSFPSRYSLESIDIPSPIIPSPSPGPSPPSPDPSPGPSPPSPSPSPSPSISSILSPSPKSPSPYSFPYLPSSMPNLFGGGTRRKRYGLKTSFKQIWTPQKAFQIMETPTRNNLFTGAIRGPAGKKSPAFGSNFASSKRLKALI
jgi:hypothetical protein